ncbi:lysostaphin resistance A-like protein [uncultured Ruthenibacterium sp.]|uniref:CPBP family intramembrane glutamic endopeptidase n=1 Tax=uncultured Ruthenibacterium sp. TaxID=1905347 RepID=UPI00349E5548
MARRQGDRLKYVANLTALAAWVYLGSTALFRMSAEKLFGFFHVSATLENPVAVPEWILGICNLLLPAVGLVLAFALMWVAVRNSTMRLKISLYLPKRAELWLFVPVLLGINLLCSLGTSLLQRFLERFTNYSPPVAVQLPQSGFAMLLYYIGICVVPAIFEELLVRGAIQKLLSHWGAWFSIVVSSVLFMLLHQDIAQMPSIFVASVLMGLAAYCTGSLAAGMVVHLANNTMSFCFLYATQKLDGISAFALTGYLTMIFGVAAIGCAIAIQKRKTMRLFKPIPRVYDPKNRQSRLERLLTAPLFLITFAGLAIRAVWPLFG